MKVKFDPNEFEVGKEYHGELVEIGEVAEKELYQAIGEPEVFIIEDGKKHWLENELTAVHYAGTGWIGKIIRIPLAELNEKYLTGAAYNVTGEPTRARDIYYPSETPIPTMFEDVRGLMTLNPVPSIKQFNNIGFDLIMPCASNTAAKAIGEAGAKMIVNGSNNAWGLDKERKYNIVGYFLWDEPELIHISPEQVIEATKRCQSNTELPVTCCFTSYFWQRTNDGWNEKWESVIEVLDFATILGYFHQGGKSPNQELVDSADEIIGKIHKMGKPVLGISQAFETKDRYLTPDFDFDAKFWKDRKCGWVWYPWNAYDDSLGKSSWYDEQVKRIIKG